MSTTLHQQLDACIEACKQASGINFFVLLEEPLANFYRAIEEGDIAEAAKSADVFLFALQKLVHFELHEETGETMLAILESHSRVPELASIHRQLSVSYDMNKRFAESERHFNAAIAAVAPAAEAGSIEDIKMIASLWHNRAQYARNGETNLELKAYNAKALWWYESINDNRGIVLCLNRLCSLLEESQVHERMAINKRILEIGKAEKDDGMILVAQMNLGYSEVEMGNSEYGLKLIRNSIARIEKDSSWRYIALAHLHLAEALAVSKQKEEAAKELHYATALFHNHGVAIYDEKINSVAAKVEAL